MSEILPLTYIDPVGRTLSGGLFTAQSSSGATGGWAEPQEIAGLDPTKTYTSAELIDTYNTAVWGLYKSGALITESLIGFNEMSYGVDIQVNGGTALQYRYGSNTCKVSTILSELNGLLGGTGVTFTLFQRKQVWMRVPDGITLTFSDPNGSIAGTGLRFLRKLLGSALGATVAGPTVFKGPELDAPFIGVYPAPEEVTNLRAPTITTTSITLEWGPSPTAGVQYLVTISGSSQKYFTGDTTWTFTGLTQDTEYVFRVRALSENAISTGFNPFNVKTAKAIPQPSAFGPDTKGLLAEFNAAKSDGTISSSSFPNTIGFKVPSSSQYIGYKFSKITFGPVARIGGGIVPALEPAYGYPPIATGDVQARIYNGFPGASTPILATANLQTTSNSQVYVFPFSSEVTITSGIYIVFVCTNAAKRVQYYYYKPTSKEPNLETVDGVINPAAQNLYNISTAYFGVLCIFSTI